MVDDGCATGEMLMTVEREPEPLREHMAQTGHAVYKFRYEHDVVTTRCQSCGAEVV